MVPGLLRSQMRSLVRQYGRDTVEEALRLAAEPERRPPPVDPSGRLVLDPAVSAESPVVRGTWVTVEHAVSLVVGGWSWADILRTHPELTEEDLRACLRYAVIHPPDVGVTPSAARAVPGGVSSPEHSR